MTNQIYIDTVVNHKLELDKLKTQNTKIYDFDDDMMVIFGKWTILNDSIMFRKNGYKRKIDFFKIIHLDEKYQVVEFDDGDGYRTWQAVLLKDNFITDDEWYEKFKHN